MPLTEGKQLNRPLMVIISTIDFMWDTMLVLTLGKCMVHGPGVTEQPERLSYEEIVKTTMREKLDACTRSNELYPSLAQNSTPENTLPWKLKEEGIV